jgi:hypothetical protein
MFQESCSRTPRSLAGIRVMGSHPQRQLRFVQANSQRVHDKVLRTKDGGMKSKMIYEVYYFGKT